MKTKLKTKQEEGITLIALVVTIVVLLILAGVSISLVLNNNGVISKAKDSKNSTERGQAQDEVNLAINYLQIEDATSTLTREERRKILEDELRKISVDSSVSISGDVFKIIHKKYEFFVDEDLNVSDSEKEFDASEWDKKAAPEDIFIWKSDDPNNADYGVVIGYKKNVDNYTVLRFPSRCTKITNDSNVFTSGAYDDTEDDIATIRSYTKNILKIELPDTVTELEYAFYNADNRFSFLNLESVELPKKLSKIEDYTFSGCRNLNIEIPDNITEIGDYAFSGCNAKGSITIPEGVKKIGAGSFEYCTNLQQINLPEGLEEIGNYAFHGTSSLSEIIIPESVKTIDKYAFSDWTASQTIKCKATKAGDNWDEYWNYNYANPVSYVTKIKSNIIWGYQDNNT